MPAGVERPSTTADGPIDHNRLGALIQLEVRVLSSPPVPDRLKTGKYAARATPISAFAAAVRRSGSRNIRTALQQTPTATPGRGQEERISNGNCRLSR